MEEISRRAFTVVRHVRENDENVHAFFKGEVFRGGERASRGDEPLDRGRISEGEEHDDSAQGPAFLEGSDEKACHVVFDAHGCEDHDEGLIFAEEPGLPNYLGREPVMRQPAPGKDRELLPADQGVHAVDRGYPGLNEVPRIDPGVGIDRFAVHVE